MASPSGLSSKDHRPPNAPSLTAHDAHHAKEIIDINVGGVHFSTTRHTLCSPTEPHSMLAAMFAGGAIPSRTDRHGCVFIDRDGERFRHVLNYLRSGTIHCHPDRITLRQLLEEAEYFGLNRLYSIVQDELNQLELEEELESMPYSSQQSDCSVATNVTDAGTSPSLLQPIARPNRGCIQSYNSPVHWNQSDAESSPGMMDHQTAPPPISPRTRLRDYTFSLNDDF